MDKQKPAEATARPWKVEDLGDMIWIEGQDKNANVICDIVGRNPDTSMTEEDSANAALICRAVNNYDGLVAACEAALEILAPGEGHEGRIYDDEPYAFLKKALAAARAE
jgi:hypothetical protein